MYQHYTKVYYKCKRNFYGSCHGNWLVGTFGPPPAGGPHSEKSLFAPRLRRGDQAKKRFLRPAHQNCRVIHKNLLVATLRPATPPWRGKAGRPGNKFCLSLARKRKTQGLGIKQTGVEVHRRICLTNVKQYGIFTLVNRSPSPRLGGARGDFQSRKARENHE